MKWYERTLALLILIWILITLSVINLLREMNTGTVPSFSATPVPSLKSLSTASNVAKTNMQKSIKRPKDASDPEKYYEQQCRGNWRVDYRKIHEENLRHSKKFLVYKCTRCGWGSRTRTLLSIFHMAVVSKRAFIIDCSLPTPIQEYLAPNYIKWNHTINTKGLSVRKQNYTVKWLAAKKTLEETDFESYFNHSVEILHRSHDMFYRHLPKNPKYNLPRWYSQELLLGCTFNFLFKRSKRLEKLLQDAKKDLGFDKNIVLGIHIRQGDDAAFNHTTGDLRFAKVEDTDHYFACAEKIDKRIQVVYNTTKVIWFLATDSGKIKEYAFKKYPKKVKQLYGPIQHVGWPKKGKGDAGYISMFLDLFLLGHSDFRLFTFASGVQTSFADAVAVVSQGSNATGVSKYKNNVATCKLPLSLTT